MTMNLFLELLWSSFLLLLATVGLLWLVPEYIQVPSKLSNHFLSPRFWPTIVLSVIGLLGFCMFIKSLYTHRPSVQARGASLDDTTPEPSATTPLQVISALLCIACMVGCLILISRIGMPAAITLCLVAFLFLSRKKASPLGIVGLLALPYLLYLFFLHVADVSIPLGMFG